MTRGWVAVVALVAIALTVHAVALLGGRRTRRPRRAGRGRDRARRTIHATGRAVRLVGLRLVPAAVGCLVLLVALDAGVGALWDRVTEPDSDSDSEVPALDLATGALPPTTDERVDSEAMAGSPWAARYFAELEALEYLYLPYIGPREAPVHGRHINSADGTRRSYEPEGARDDDALTVWFFGGSTLWGEGQRDLHTIPSAVARLAEADGVDLRVENFGIRGYTAFQEFLVFEQELARREPPDLAVFYHGVNELSTLLEGPRSLGAQPSIYQLDTTADAFDRAPPLPQARQPEQPSVAGDYLETSLLNKLFRSARDAIERPAGAEQPPYQPTRPHIDRAMAEAAQIYRRSVGLIEHAAAEHGVPSLQLWQPSGPPPPSPAIPDDYGELGDRVADLHVDISDALAGATEPIYLDGVHTNELGATLSARAVWRHLAPMVEGVRGG